MRAFTCCPLLVHGRGAIAVLAERISTVLGDNPDGLSGSERWIGALPSH